MRVAAAVSALLGRLAGVWGAGRCFGGVDAALAGPCMTGLHITQAALPVLGGMYRVEAMQHLGGNLVLSARHACSCEDPDE